MPRGTFRYLDRWNSTLADAVKDDAARDMLENRDRQLEEFLDTGFPKGPFFVITDYGARTNRDDNSPAVQRAINAANAAGGGIVYVPGGEYQIATQIDLTTAEAVTIMGTGRGSSALYAAQVSDDYMFLINGVNPKVTIRDLGIYSSNIGVSHPGGSIIRVENFVGWVQIVNCDIVNWNYDHSIHLPRGSSLVQIDNCRFQDSDQQTILACDVTEAMEEFEITNCWFQFGLGSIELGAGNGNRHEEVVIDNCWFYNQNSGTRPSVKIDTGWKVKMTNCAWSDIRNEVFVVNDVLDMHMDGIFAYDVGQRSGLTQGAAFTNCAEVFAANINLVYVVTATTPLVFTNCDYAFLRSWRLYTDAGAGTFTQSGSILFESVDRHQHGTADILDDAITNAELANMATASFKGRVTAGTGDPEDLTGTQATTLLDVFTSALKGVAPASGGGTAKYLRADATWDEPTLRATTVAYAATVTPDADTTDILNIGALTAGLTLNAPTGTPVDGQTLVLRCLQDGTGGYTITYNAAYAFGTDVTNTDPAGANAKWERTFRWNATDSKWRAVDLVRGF
jgi:Pectate lyase superfamily protein